MIRLSSAAAALLAATQLSRLAAQESQDTTALPEIVVTVDRYPTRADSVAAAITVVTGEELRAQGIRYVGDALRQVPGEGVWSVTCFFVEKGHRGSGLSVALLHAAVEHARRRGAKVVEGYPVEPRTGKMPAAFAWTGLRATFERAGLSEVNRRSSTRPTLRLSW